MSHNIIVILICIALVAWSVYREYRRKLKRYLLWRITATLIAIIALGCLILPVAYWGNTKKTSDSYILLTPGYSKDSLRTKSNDSIYTLDKIIHQEYPKAKLVSDLSIISAPLQVFGYGLTKDELAQLGNRSISFHPSPVPDGILAASWTDQIEAGEDLTVQLKYKNSTQNEYKLLLTGLNTTLDSAIIRRNAETSITLRTKPRSTGKLLHHLIVVDGQDTLQREDIPVSIKAAKQLNVLILSASPNFETKFLKTWMGQNGYGVASRSAISKGKYSQEFINTAQTEMTSISTQLLNKFDVLVTDGLSLQSLNPAESNALQQAVSEKGIGVIIRADSVRKTTSWFQREFSVNHILGKQPVTIALYLQGNHHTAKLTADPLYINDQNNLQALVTDGQQHILAAAALAGSGKLVFTTLNNSYMWLLGGNKNDYYALWSLLLTKAACNTPAPANWTLKNSISVVNQPVNLGLENNEPTKNIEINGTKVYPATDVTALFKKNITYWPGKIGWQEIMADNTAYNWYTWGENSWKSLKSAGKQAITDQYVAKYYKESYFSAKKGNKIRESVPKIYFFILFFLACTFLWAERQFFNK